MFSGDGECWSSPSRRGSVSVVGKKDDDEGLFRDFTFTGEHHRSEREKRRSSFGFVP
jgi:hypothetical protein